MDLYLLEMGHGLGAVWAWCSAAQQRQRKHEKLWENLRNTGTGSIGGKPPPTDTDGHVLTLSLASLPFFSPSPLLSLSLLLSLRLFLIPFRLLFFLAPLFSSSLPLLPLLFLLPLPSSLPLLSFLSLFLFFNFLS